MNTNLATGLTTASEKVMKEKKVSTTIKVDLQVAIEREGQEPLKTVELRRPKVRDLQIAEANAGDDFSKTINLICSLSMLSPEEVAEMDGGDYMVFRDHINSFLGMSQ